MRLLVFAMLVSQLPATTPRAIASKASLSGVVLQAGTTQPVMGAKVAVNRLNASTGRETSSSNIQSVSISGNGVELPTPLALTGQAALPLPIPVVTTDRDGKFVVPDLDSGVYKLTVSLNGYVKQEFGQRVFPGQGVPITLGEGQAFKDLVVRLTPTGNISGRIRDTKGQPATGVPVQIFKSAFSAQGQRIIQSAGATRTNDRGEYRLYWATPGRYYVAAGSPQGFVPGTALAAGGPVVTPNESVETYIFTYYPGVSDLATASLIDITPGSEQVVDFVVVRELYKISGRVLSEATGRPPSYIRASLAYSVVTGGGGTSTFNAPYNSDTGIFEISDVLPGAYFLQISATGGVTRLPLEVRGDVVGLSIVIPNGLGSLQGRVIVEGSQESLEKFRVQLRPSSGPACTLGAATVSPIGPALSPDGSFRLDNVLPGDYCVGIAGSNIMGPPPDYYIKEATFDQDDILEHPLRVTSRMPPGSSIKIVLGAQSGVVEGAVTDDKGQPVVGVQAALVPDQNRNRFDLYKAATTDQNGRFTMRVAPGDYKLFAWETLEPFGYFDPELLRKSESSGVAVHVGESSKVETRVKTIP